MIFAVQLLKMAHLLDINTVTKHSVCLSWASLAVSKDCAVEAMNQFRNAILHELEHFRLLSVPPVHLVVLALDCVGHVLDSNWLAGLSNVADAFFCYFQLQLRSYSDGNSDFLWACLISLRLADYCKRSTLKWWTTIRRDWLLPLKLLLIKHLLVEAALYFDSYVINGCGRISIFVELWWVHRLWLIPLHQLSHQCLLLLLMKVAWWHLRCLPHSPLLVQLLLLEDWSWCRLLHDHPCQVAPGSLVSVVRKYLYLVCCSSLVEPLLCVVSLHVEWV